MIIIRKISNPTNEVNENSNVAFDMPLIVQAILLYFYMEFK